MSSRLSCLLGSGGSMSRSILEGWWHSIRNLARRVQEPCKIWWCNYVRYATTPTCSCWTKICRWLMTRYGDRQGSSSYWIACYPNCYPSSTASWSFVRWPTSWTSWRCTLSTEGSATWDWMAPPKLKIEPSGSTFLVRRGRRIASSCYPPGLEVWGSTYRLLIP